MFHYWGRTQGRERKIFDFLPIGEGEKPPTRRPRKRKKNTWRPEHKGTRVSGSCVRFLLLAGHSSPFFSFPSPPVVGPSFSRIKKKLRRDRKNKAHESVSTHTEVVESRCQRWVLLFARTKLRPGRLERRDRRTRVDRRDRSSSRGEDRNRRRRRRRLSAVKEGRTKEEELLRRRRRRRR